MAFPRFALISLAISAIACTFISFTEAIEDRARAIGDGFGRLISFALAYIAPADRLAFAAEGYVDCSPGGQPLDRSLLQSLRHESGVPRYSAARSI
jgi:hypothetical protein